MTTARRTRLVAILLCLAASAALLIAWTQPWFALELREGPVVTAAGDTAAPGLAALGLAGLALAAALGIAGRIFRIVLGALQLLIAGTALLEAALALGDPIAASAPVVTATTGVDGIDSVRELVVAVGPSGWPWVALLASLLGLAAGLAVLVLGSRWPNAGRRYQAVRMRNDADETPSPVDHWDALSDGDDPTAR